MSLLTRINQGTHQLHTEAEKKTFIARYAQNKHTLTDHYRHLSQLLPVYQLLEKKLNDPTLSINLPEKLHFLLFQSQKINEDLFFIKTHFSFNFDSQLLPTTRAYLSYLEHLDPAQHSIEIFAHFLTRVLGDLFGGQKLKDDVRALFLRKNLFIYNEDGIHFYHFEKNSLKQLSSWINEELTETLTSEDEKKLIACMNDSFRHHIQLFDELENTRLNLKSCCLFFTKVAVASTIAATGATLALTYTLQ